MFSNIFPSVNYNVYKMSEFVLAKTRAQVKCAVFGIPKEPGDIVLPTKADRCGVVLSLGKTWPKISQQWKRTKR
jgi:hypothetical protein